MLKKLVGATMLPIVVALSFLVTRGAPIPRDTRQPVLFFPTHVGATWAYECDGIEFTRQVTSVDNQRQVKIVTVSDIGPLGQATRCDIVEVSESGLVLLFQDGKFLGPPLQWLKVSPQFADTWNCDIAQMGEIPIGGIATAKGIEAVELPSITFKAIRVDRSYTSGCDGNSIQTWFSLGIGVVKEKCGVHTTVLKSFASPK